MPLIGKNVIHPNFSHASLDKTQEIIKAYFVQFPSPKQTDNLTTYLLIQLRNRLITINIQTGQFKSFDADSEVPILQHHPETCIPYDKAKNDSVRVVSFYKHVNEGDGNP